MSRYIADVDTVLWFLRRPRYYPQLLRNLKTRIAAQSSREKTREAAEAWCQSLAIDTHEAISRITGLSDFLPIRDKFKNIFSVCDQIAQSCSARMGGAANIDLLYYVSEYIEAKKIVETGVSYGWSSLSFLLSLANRDNGLLVSTDMPYPMRQAEKYIGCVVPKELRSRWLILNLADREALPRALQICNTIDLCHYDSNKSYQERMWAYPVLWQALRSGGYFISDDVGDNLGFHDFCHTLAIEPMVIKTPRRQAGLYKYVGVLVKP